MKNRLQKLSIYLGNLFEHYDAALFGFLSPFLAPLIFPKEDALTALILTYAMIPLGMVARPIGALLLGYVGDVYSRERAFFVALIGMAFVSCAFACVPLYAQIGVLAPILVCLGRAFQNFFAAGETMGGAIFLLENVPSHKQDVRSGWYGVSTIGGHLLASSGVLLAGYYVGIEKGWRILYLLGCVTALFGVLIRDKGARNGVQRRPPLAEAWTSFKQTIQGNLKPLVLIAVVAGFGYANYTMALVLTNGFIPLISSFTKIEVMQINTYLLVLDLCALPVFGWIASRISREKLMLMATGAIIVLAIPSFIALKGASWMTVIGVRVVLVILGVAFFAPFHAWAQQLVPKEGRYTIISFGYALGSQLIGGPTAAISLYLFKQTGIIASVAWYWIALAILSSCAVILAWKEKKEEAWL